MKFTKMQGLGNDYIYVNCLEESVQDASGLSVKLSDRHFGIGSDGLILIKPSDKADFEMEMYNADGSRAEMCGNGIRCVGKFVYDKGLTGQTSVSIDTLAGIKYLTLNVVDGKVESVRVNMGAPILEPAQIPVQADKSPVVAEPITVEGKEYSMTCISMGNPHCVVFIKDVEHFPLEDIGPHFENHERFPNRINTEFAEMIDRKTIRMRVWERGSGETLACGTGACATAVAAMLNGLADDEVTVKLLGGDLKICWDRKENIVYMTGPAVTVFEGEVTLCK